jgi:Flp pilus assembly CpaF family ATPase
MLLEDRANIEEIVVNSPNTNICVYHSMHGFCTTNLRFNSERDFRYMINKTIKSTERELSSTAPIIDAQLDDGSRVHAQLKPYALNGAAASIRLNGGKSMDVKRLMELSTASPELLAYLWLAIETNHNMVVTGAPASGKTSLLLALNAFVPRYQRVITIEEDVNELKFYSNFTNSVSLQGSTIGGKASTRDQVINALHLRPDRLIVGEIRGKEACELLSGSNFGVPFMTTMHSSGNGQAVIGRLQSKPMSVEPDIISMLDVSVFMRQCGLMARRIDSVMEYKWLCRDEVGVEDLDTGSQMNILEVGKDGALEEGALERSKVLRSYSDTHAFTMARSKKELRNRASFLKAMLEGDRGAGAAERIASYNEIK